MRPLSPSRSEKIASAKPKSNTRHFLFSVILAGAVYWTAGCAVGGTGSVQAPPPPPPSISVAVNPRSATVLLGKTVPFSATVSNASNQTVTWSVNGVAGGSAASGTISASGVYSAPTDLPANANVQVTATSQADTTKSAAATATISSDISVSLSPGASAVELGTTQTFQVSVASAGQPDTTVRWSLSGPTCPTNCGAIDANGKYAAPQILPSPASVTVTATSAADPSRKNSANVTITSSFTLQLSAPSSQLTGATQAVVATLTPVPGSNPSSSLNWSLSGSGCSGTGCGILIVTTTQTAGGNSIADTANYTAPAVAPTPNTVTITVTPVADPTKKAQASIAIQPGGGIGISPQTATLAALHRVTLTATQSGSPSTTLNWSVNGIPGGNTTFGQLCVVGSVPCQGVTSTTAAQVDYVAPGAIPSSNPASVSLSSASNASISASSQITVINHVLVSVFPGSATLPPLGVQGFTASVLGTGNQNVVWQIQGTGCGTSGACGAITPFGAFAAPTAPPSPNAITIVAISQDDTSQSGSANVTISTGANILSLHPASVYTGAADGFLLRTDGSGFIASNPGPGSVLLIGGTPRLTTCDSANSCSAPVAAADVAAAGTVNVQIKNPDLTASNVVHLVVAAMATTEDVVSLSAASPVATGKDITVVEPTTAGADTSGAILDLNMAALGVFVTSTNTCNLQGNPILLLRPASGTIAADICLFSQAGFDTSMSYIVSGSGDVSVIAKQPAGLGIIHLTLQLPSSAATGARTLFIQNANLDRTAASGALEIQ